MFVEQPLSLLIIDISSIIIVFWQGVLGILVVGMSVQVKLQFELFSVSHGGCGTTASPDRGQSEALKLMAQLSRLDEL